MLAPLQPSPPGTLVASACVAGEGPPPRRSLLNCSAAGGAAVAVVSQALRVPGVRRRVPRTQRARCRRAARGGQQVEESGFQEPVRHIRHDQPTLKSSICDGIDEFRDPRLLHEVRDQFRIACRRCSSFPGDYTVMAFAEANSKGINTLSREQRFLVNLVVEQGRSVFFTGAAGTGKTRTLKELAARCKDEGLKTYVTALTGVAATLLPDGRTLHSFAGIGRGQGDRDDLTLQASTVARQNWTEVEVLIIDEVSMMSKELFETLDYIAKKIRDVPDKPFGGITVVLCGDFFQLPPVSDDPDSDQSRYCFESDAWTKLLKPSEDTERENSFELSGSFRYMDADLRQLLDEIRHDNLDKGKETLKRLGRELECEDGIEPTMLYSRNHDVDEVNQRRLEHIDEESRRVYLAIDDFPEELEGAKVPFAFPQELELREGAQVILLKNMNRMLVNGSRGVVEGFMPFGNVDLPQVRFANGTTLLVPFCKDSVVRTGVKATRHQLPLRLAWAMTIHKSQGMTIDKLKVSLKGVFNCGQSYVALSRARSLDGLQVVDWDPDDPDTFMVEKKVLDFYDRMRTAGNVLDSSRPRLARAPVEKALDVHEESDEDEAPALNKTSHHR